MDNAFNMSLRKFLKRLGVTGQQAIEEAIRTARADGRLAETDSLPVCATIRIEALDLEHRIQGRLEPEARD